MNFSPERSSNKSATLQPLQIISELYKIWLRFEHVPCCRASLKAWKFGCSDTVDVTHCDPYNSLYLYLPCRRISDLIRSVLNCNYKYILSPTVTVLLDTKFPASVTKWQLVVRRVTLRDDTGGESICLLILQPFSNRG
jgi:hypothetical protein